MWVLLIVQVVLTASFQSIAPLLLLVADSENLTIGIHSGS